MADQLYPDTPLPQGWNTPSQANMGGMPGAPASGRIDILNQEMSETSDPDAKASLQRQIAQVNKESAPLYPDAPIQGNNTQSAAPQQQVYKPSQIELVDHSVDSLKNAYRAMGGNPDLVDQYATDNPDHVSPWEELQQNSSVPPPSTAEGQFGHGVSRFMSDLKNLISSPFASDASKEVDKMKTLMSQHKDIQFDPNRVDNNGDYVAPLPDKIGYGTAAAVTSALALAGGEAVVPELAGEAGAAKLINAGRTLALNAGAGAVYNPTNPGEGAIEGMVGVPLAKGVFKIGAAGAKVLPGVIKNSGSIVDLGKDVVKSGIDTVAQNPRATAEAAALAGAEAMGWIPSGAAEGLAAVRGYNVAGDLLTKWGKNLKNEEWYRANSHLFGRP